MVLRTTRQSSQVQESDSHGGYGAWQPSEVVWVSMVSLLYRLKPDANATNIPHSSIVCTCAHYSSPLLFFAHHFSDITLSNNPDLHWNTLLPLQPSSAFLCRRILSGQVLKIRVQVGHLLPSRPEGRKYKHRNGRGEARKLRFFALIEHKLVWVW